MRSSSLVSHSTHSSNTKEDVQQACISQLLACRNGVLQQTPAQSERRPRICAAYPLLSPRRPLLFLGLLQGAKRAVRGKVLRCKVRAEPLVFLLVPCKDVGRLSFARLFLCSMNHHSICKSTAYRQRYSSCQQRRYSPAARPLRAPHKSWRR